MANTAQLLEDSLLVIWNNRNAEQRLEAMKKIYARDIHFFESNTGEPVIGYPAINDLISKLQAGWPAEFRFQLNRASQVNHQVQMISWDLGAQGGPPAATGMDVAVIENDLIQSLHLFLGGSSNTEGIK